MSTAPPRTAGASGLRVRALTAEDAALWFRPLAGTPSPAELARLAETLAGGPLRPHLRAVLELQGRIVGRFAAERREDAIRFWIPWFRPEIAAGERKHAMRLTLDDLVARRAAEGLEALPLETRTGDDEPDNALWLAVLADAGFAALSTYRVYILGDLAAPRRPPARRGIVVRAAAPDDLAQIPALYRAAYADTLDRRPRALDEADAYIRELRSFGIGYDPTLWLVAAVNRELVGFALANCAHEDAFQGLSAWLLEIGCLKQHRGQGVAGALMTALLPRLAKAGARRLLATVDDANTPSLRLHASLGFVAQKDRHHLLRRER
jgi:L-amino acid N-acyltransferase YncA